MDAATTPTAAKPRPPILYYALAGGAVVAFIFFIAAFTRHTNSSVHGKTFRRHVLALTEQAGQKGAAARQDENPLFRVIHATEALAAARMTKVLVPNQDDLNRIVQMDMEELTFSLQHEQNAAIARLTQRCPTLQVPAQYGDASGWASA
jgi:hypothetical protein